jgi:hypothetical protein
VNACATSSSINDGSLVLGEPELGDARVAGEAVASRPYALTARILQALSGSAARKHSASFSEPPNADHHTGADVPANDGRLVVFNAIPSAAPVTNDAPAATVSATMARPV